MNDWRIHSSLQSSGRTLQAFRAVHTKASRWESNCFPGNIELNNRDEIWGRLTSSESDKSCILSHAILKTNLPGKSYSHVKNRGETKMKRNELTPFGFQNKRWARLCARFPKPLPGPCHLARWITSALGHLALDWPPPASCDTCSSVGLEALWQRWHANRQRDPSRPVQPRQKLSWPDLTPVMWRMDLVCVGEKPRLMWAQTSGH